MALNDKNMGDMSAKKLLEEFNKREQEQDKIINNFRKKFESIGKEVDSQINTIDKLKTEISKLKDDIKNEKKDNARQNQAISGIKKSYRERHNQLAEEVRQTKSSVSTQTRSAKNNNDNINILKNESSNPLKSKTSSDAILNYFDEIAKTNKASSLKSIFGGMSNDDILNLNKNLNKREWNGGDVWKHISANSRQSILAKETDKLTDNFKAMDKQLEKINNRLNLFAIALGLKGLNWVHDQHKQRQDEIHSGYEAGLDYQQTRMWGSFAKGLGVEPERLYGDFASLRRIHDRWGLGVKDLFDNEEQQKFLVGGSPLSLGYSVSQLAGKDPVAIMEMAMRDTYAKMKADPNKASSWEAQANSANLGSIGTIAYKAFMGDINLEDALRAMKIAVDSPKGMEQATFKYGLDFQEGMARFRNSLDRVTIRLFEFGDAIFSVLNKIPFLNTAIERTEKMEDVRHTLETKGVDSQEFIDSLYERAKVSPLSWGNWGLHSTIGKVDNIKALSIVLRDLRESDSLDNDFGINKQFINDIGYKAIYSNNFRERHVFQKAILDSFDFYDGRLGNKKTIEEAFDKGDYETIRNFINGAEYMENVKDWEKRQERYNRRQAEFSYDSGINNLNPTRTIPTQPAQTQTALSYDPSKEKQEIKTEIIINDRTTGGIEIESAIGANVSAITQ